MTPDRPSLSPLRRRVLTKLAQIKPAARVLERFGIDTERLRIASRYDAAYYEGGVKRQAGRTGYGTYTRISSNANAAAWLVWSYFKSDSILDVGCAKGHFVEAVNEIGLTVSGLDLSRDAVAMANHEITHLLSVAALPDRLPVDENSVDLLVLLETLEHLRPQEIPAALAELRRVSNGYLLVTIPSIGRNSSGPNGWFEGKVRAEALEKYQALGLDYEGPVPFEDLAVDDANMPIEGHLTIASYSWWRRAFAEAGFVSCDKTERYLTHEITRFGLAEFWCVYVFRIDDVTELVAPSRPIADRLELEKRWGLRSNDVPQAVLDASEARLNEIGVDLVDGLVT